MSLYSGIIAREYNLNSAILIPMKDRFSEVKLVMIEKTAFNIRELGLLSVAVDSIEKCQLLETVQDLYLTLFNIRLWIKLSVSI